MLSSGPRPGRCRARAQNRRHSVARAGRPAAARSPRAPALGGRPAPHRSSTPGRSMDPPEPRVAVPLLGLADLPRNLGTSPAPVLELLLPLRRHLAAQVARGVDDVHLGGREVAQRRSGPAGGAGEDLVADARPCPRRPAHPRTSASQSPSACRPLPPQGRSSRSSAARKWNSRRADHAATVGKRTSCRRSAAA